MATSEIEICNAALALVGEPQIAAFDDSNEAERQCDVLYELCRDALLRNHPWNFAEKLATFEQLSETPAFEFTYYYQLPSDCIRVLDLYNTDEDYRIIGRKLAINDTSVSATYTSKETDVSKFDPLFTQALIYYLAAQLSIILPNKTGLHAQLMAFYDQIMRQAKQMDGQEGTSRKVSFVDDWRNVRRLGGFFGKKVWIPD